QKSTPAKQTGGKNAEKNDGKAGGQAKPRAAAKAQEPAASQKSEKTQKAQKSQKQPKNAKEEQEAPAPDDSQAAEAFGDAPPAPAEGGPESPSTTAATQPQSRAKNSKSSKSSKSSRTRGKARGSGGLVGEYASAADVPGGEGSTGAPEVEEKEKDEATDEDEAAGRKDSVVEGFDTDSDIPGFKKLEGVEEPVPASDELRPMTDLTELDFLKSDDEIREAFDNGIPLPEEPGDGVKLLRHSEEEPAPESVRTEIGELIAQYQALGTWERDKSEVVTPEILARAGGDEDRAGLQGWTDEYWRLRNVFNAIRAQDPGDARLDRIGRAMERADGECRKFKARLDRRAEKEAEKAATATAEKPAEKSSNQPGEVPDAAPAERATEETPAAEPAPVPSPAEVIAAAKADPEPGSVVLAKPATHRHYLATYKDEEPEEPGESAVLTVTDPKSAPAPALQAPAQEPGAPAVARNESTVGTDAASPASTETPSPAPAAPARETAAKQLPPPAEKAPEKAAALPPPAEKRRPSVPAASPKIDPKVCRNDWGVLPLVLSVIALGLVVASHFTGRQAFAVVDRELVRERVALMRIAHARPGMPERADLKGLDANAIDRAIRAVAGERGVTVIDARAVLFAPERRGLADLTQETLSRLGVGTAELSILEEAVKEGWATDFDRATRTAGARGADLMPGRTLLGRADEAESMPRTEDILDSSFHERARRIYERLTEGAAKPPAVAPAAPARAETLEGLLGMLPGLMESTGAEPLKNGEKR
ncbi:MAG: hypothetical protein Q4F91_07810, partial [Sutterella sp.]|nr:hypothetical protein [Sutterella sp.]